ncbi:hypothetical protein [Actinoallomurus sp. NPDC052274]|uniref:hypothetical protein n=1 Tax=Actinoallomurus sp. NPDC052274 TaxID=3155420 RepID=UPI00343DEEAA
MHARQDVVLDRVGSLAQLGRPADDLDGARGTAGLDFTLVDGTRRRMNRTSHDPFTVRPPGAERGSWPL